MKKYYKYTHTLVYSSELNKL